MQELWEVQIKYTSISQTYLLILLPEEDNKPYKMFYK